jgi:hypothetical protein
MRSLAVSIYSGHFFDNNGAAIVPKNEGHVNALWAFCSDTEFARLIRVRLRMTFRGASRANFDAKRGDKSSKFATFGLSNSAYDAWKSTEIGILKRTLRTFDKSVKVTNATLAKVPFDPVHWSKVASERYPQGLPKPYSNNPTPMVV